MYHLKTTDTIERARYEMKKKKERSTWSLWSSWVANNKQYSKPCIQKEIDTWFWIAFRVIESWLLIRCFRCVNMEDNEE